LSERMPSYSAGGCVNGERRVWFWWHTRKAGLFTYLY